jgi:hypothetical protein
VIDPAEIHYYQPGWTMVGAGVFRPETTARRIVDVLRGVKRIQAAVAGFEPDAHAVVLDGCRRIGYRKLIVCPGLKLDWDAIEGLADTLGHNGVTSNYRYDLAPYTWQLVQAFRGGNALFTQPPMPIKCAGAPQKAMYMSCDHWRRNGRLGAANVEFLNAGAVLFGVADYVPALMEYVERYDIALSFGHNLIAIDGPARRATFRRTLPDGSTETVQRNFDMIHVVPPQKAPDFVRASPLADAAGWIDVDPATLRHKRFPTSSRSATSPTPPTRKPPRPRASRRPWSRTTCWRRSAACRATPRTTATARARSRSSAARSCSPNSCTAARSRRPSRVADRRPASVAARVAAQGAPAAAAVLEGDAQGPRMAREARDRTLTGSR